MWPLKYQAEADFMLAKAAFTHEWSPLQMNQKYNGYFVITDGAQYIRACYRNCCASHNKRKMSVWSKVYR